jgi:hypothetical protein
MNLRRHNLDITSVIDREEIVAAFGAAAMWRATITVLTKREARETDPRRKRHLRLMLLNAQTQLALVTEGA